MGLSQPMEKKRQDSVRFFLKASEYERIGEIGQGIYNLKLDCILIHIFFSHGAVWEGLST